ncbi:hypothetical protein G6F57_013801 [Rhizopus arrhizus]|nr:hypothetical protein G6F23_011462 [Rhizopus arrhizus]KAG0900682.1 hypothetical protein G6F33_013085 [Rhizopus arrhizus]KAG0973913.1 hypothetical protein G6F29_012546 [Rhizopus arrhizus]KAG0977276.1 hypothetical protein G6F28_012431 [Rhizopus arrhizus]KAG1001925.1 hypothetical protein G6F27_012427 [Rhizopus arrhizus]
MDPTSLESSVKRLRLSESALAIINAPSSKKTIPYIQTTFINWCSIRDINHQEHPINSILNFLAEYHALKNWKTSTTLTYASQILQLYPSTEQATIRISEEYVQFCKSLKANTIRPLKTADYDITPALNYLVSLGPTDTLPKDLLTAKTAWLLSMVGFLRPSDVERVDLNQCSVSSDSVLKLVIVAPKEKREGTRITKAVTIHPHENPLLCPVLAYQVYHRRIAQLDALTPHPVFPEVTINALFRNQHDHSIAIGSERISKHVKSVMQFISRPSGTPIPKARALASTLAAQSGISVDDIVVRGNWSSKELFEQFYRISVTTSTDFTRVTLNAQQRSDSSKCNTVPHKTLQVFCFFSFFACHQILGTTIGSMLYLI